MKQVHIGTEVVLKDGRKFKSERILGKNILGKVGKEALSLPKNSDLLEGIQFLMVDRVVPKLPGLASVSQGVDDYGGYSGGY